jgi:hypothetical protein
MEMSPQMFNQRYSHLLPTMQKDAVSRIDDKIRKAMLNMNNPVDN